jgi:hypothetical protein
MLDIAYSHVRAEDPFIQTPQPGLPPFMSNDGTLFGLSDEASLFSTALQLQIHTEVQSVQRSDLSR